MKRVFLVFMVLFLVGVSVYSQTNTQWDFFKNVIPRQKSIKISGSDRNSGWTMTINDKYIVAFSGSYRYGWSHEWRANERLGKRYKNSESTDATFNGTGVIVWDNEKLKLELTINGSGSHNTEWFNLDRPYENDGRFVSKDIYSASGSNRATLAFDILPQYENGGFTGRLSLPTARTFTLNMTGNTSSSVSLTIGGSNLYTATLDPKSESELNAASKDAFGEWSWNADRTRLFLKAQNSANNFVILNENGKLTWRMEMEKGTKGASESTTDTGDKLVNLSMAFDGTAVQIFSFIENNNTANPNIMQLDYAVYNRFLGTLDKKSNVILNQIKDKGMLILTYTVNGAQKTDMFILEGLDTIMDYLSE